MTLIENVRKPFHPSRWFNCVLIKWHKAAFCSMNYTNRTWPGQSEWSPHHTPPPLNWNYLLPPHFFHHKSLNSSTIVSNEPHIYSFAVPLSLNVFAVAVKLRWQQPNIWKQPLILNHCVWENYSAPSSHLHRDSGRGAHCHMSWFRRRRASRSDLSRQFESEGFGWRSLKKITSTVWPKWQVIQLSSQSLLAPLPIIQHEPLQQFDIMRGNRRQHECCS